MRAILLVKDKEGLNAERLQNSRYGLTGKPILTQQGVAGSLSSSFKASQEVTTVNLRSLTDKLREAQKALDGANNNIDRTDKKQDQMDEDKDKVNQLLSSGAWELLWTGAISPFKFYSTKYNEDVSNKAMAGEAGFSVVDVGEDLDVAPIPRTPYWDPILTIDKITETDYDTARRLLPTNVRNYFNDRSQDNLVKIWGAVGVILGIASLYSNLSAVLPELSFMTITFSIVLSLLAGLLRVAYSDHEILYKDENAVSKTQKTDNYLIVQNYPKATPAMYTSGVYGMLEFRLYNLINQYLLEIDIVGGMLNLALSAVLTLAYIAKALLTNQFTAAAGAAVEAVALSIESASFFTALSLMMYCLIILTLFLSSEESMSNCTYTGFSEKTIIGHFIKNVLGISWLNSYDNAYFNTLTDFKGISSMDIYHIVSVDWPHSWTHNWEDQVTLKTALTGTTSDKAILIGRAGNHHQYDDGNSTFEYVCTTIAGLLSAIHIVNSFVLNHERLKYIAPIAYTGVKPDSKECEVGLNLGDGADTPWSFNDWFNNGDIAINYSVNDPITEYVGNLDYGHTYVLGKGILMKSKVYDFDYFGVSKGIKLYNKAIEKTIVIRTKALIHKPETGDGTYYACMALVQFAGESKLYLLWERNAIYTPDYHLFHCEQMIYNYDVYNLPTEKPLTNDRRGQLEYFYVEDRPDYDKPEEIYFTQFRNVRNSKQNTLNGNVINTEYNFNNYIYLRRSPMNYPYEGTRKSYSWNN